MRNTRTVTITAGLALLAIGLSTLCLAQTAPAPPQRSRVFITHVKPDMLHEWMDIQKNELVPALKKAGIKSRTVYQTTFGNTYEYVALTPLEKFADLDAGNRLADVLGPEGAARLSEKSRKCIDSTQSFVSTRLGDLSNPTAPPSEPPAIIVSTRLRVAPGRMQDFENLIKTEILPVYQKGKVNYTVSRRGFGANSNDVVVGTPYSKFAELDGPSPLLRLLGQEAVNKLMAKFAGVTTVIETVVRRRVPELSY